MNQRVIVIVLLTLFTTCFVSSGALITLKVIGGVVNSAKDNRAKRLAAVRPEPVDSLPALPQADEPLTSVAPPPKPAVPEPDELDAEEPEDDEAEYAPPLLAGAEFAVFHMDKAKVDPWVALQKAAKGTKVKVFQNEAPASAVPPYMELRDLSTADYAVIAGASLDNGRGLTDTVKKSLPKAKRVSVVDVWMPLGGQSLLETSKVMLAFAHATGGVLWDEETNEYLSADAWKLRRVDSWDKGVPNVSLQVKLYEDALDEDTINLRTGGMKHLGLPELVLEGVAYDVKEDASSMLLATAQTLAERKGPVLEGPLEVSIPKLKHAAFRKELLGITAKNAERAIDVTLIGGDSTRLPTLIVRPPSGGNPEQRVEAALDTLFGFGD